MFLQRDQPKIDVMQNQRLQNLTYPDGNAPPLERLKKCRSRRRETVAAALQLSLSLHALTGAATGFLEPRQSGGSRCQGWRQWHPVRNSRHRRRIRKFCCAK